MNVMLRYLFLFVLVMTIVFQLNAVTADSVKCPTNKIAPHRRQRDGGEQVRPRTLGLIHDLIGTRNPPLPNRPLDSLQERPQEDDPEDCGEIEDYDETDLSSLTSGANRKSDRKIRVITHGDGGPIRPPKYPMPLKPPRQKKPARPVNTNEKPQQSFGELFTTGNFFGYRPPGPDFFPTSNKYWIDHIKPVTEDIIFDNPPKPYRLGLVGGVVGNVVGFVPKRPPPPPEELITPTPEPIDLIHPEQIRFPGKSTHKHKRKKPKSLNRRLNKRGRRKRPKVPYKMLEPSSGSPPPVTRQRRWRHGKRRGSGWSNY